MTHDDVTKKIETEIAHERKALADSLSELTDQFAPEKMMASVSEAIKTHGGDLAETVMRNARENPVAVGLIGVGVAWLLFNGTSRKASEPSRPYDGSDRAPSPGFARDTSPDSFTSRLAAAEAAIQEERYGVKPEASETSGLRARVAKSAAHMRDMLYDGTHELSDIARERVIQAREKAIMAQHRIEAAAVQASDSGRRLFADQPLLVGAAVAAAGAAAAMALPRTQIEDNQFGAHRDTLVEEATRVWHEEVARAKRVGSAVADEAKVMANEAAAAMPSGNEAVDAAEGTLRSSAERLVDRAKEAAQS